MSNDSGPFLSLFDEPQRNRLLVLLARAGWEKFSEVPGRYATWKPRDEGSEAGVLVPLDDQRDDYTALYERALRDLHRSLGSRFYSAIIEAIESETERDLALTSWSRASGTASGTIPWLDGQSVHSSITRQLTAAAKAAVSPAPRLGRSGEYFAREFMQATILAPSGSGSYVVNALTPVHRPLYTSAAAQREQRPENGPIEAAAVLRLFDAALSAIVTGLEQSSEDEAVAVLVNQASRGVSFELVTSLVEFIAGQEVAITVPRDAWTDAAPEEYAFEPPNVRVLAQAAEVMRKEDDATRATMTGIITKLEHEPGSDEFVVRVFTTSRGPVRRVSLHVSEEDYARCLNAHGDDSLIRVRGRLSKEGKYWTIRSPEDLVVLDADESTEASPYDLFTSEED